MSKYKGLFTFDVDNHRYVTVGAADGIIDCVDYEPSIRDEKTKQLFINYLKKHPDERFMQAVRNFIGVSFLVATSSFPRDGEDTFFWECDELLGEEEE